MSASKLDINLLAQAGFARQPLGKFLSWSLSYGRYIIITTQIIVLLAFFSRFKLDQDLSDLHSKMEEKVHIIEALAPIENNTRSIQRKLEIIKQLETSRGLYFTTLQTLATQTSNDIAIKQIAITQNKLTLSGNAINIVSFNNFLTFIRKNKLFSQISLDQVSKNTDNQTLTFNLSMEIQE